MDTLRKSVKRLVKQVALLAKATCELGLLLCAWFLQESRKQVLF